MTIIDPQIQEEIGLKLQKIARNPRYYDERKELVIDEIRSLGDVYSFWIENPELRRSLLFQNKQPGTIRKMAKQGIQAVHNGWYYISHIGKYGGFVENLNEEVLERVNGLILGNKNEGRFRKKDVTLTIPGYTPTSWERVPDRVRELLLRIKEEYQSNHLESSILFHLGITAIQPFLDGNKRTARLGQDRLLFDAEMPPAVIPAGEGVFYFNLLKKTLPAYRDKDIAGQKQFFDYCASKVNNGLDKILGDLEEEPALKV